MKKMDNYKSFSDIEKAVGSPFYLFDQYAFARNMRDLRDAFERRYPNVAIGYSYKTNYIPFICRLAHELGALAEVVSRLELDLAFKIGCRPEGIIFNGPVKSEEDIALALNEGMLVNIDNLRELEQVVAFARRYPGKFVHIGLRVNISLLDEHGNSQLQGGLPSGRFGFSEETLVEAVRNISGVPNLSVQALHGHTSSSTRSLWVYRAITRRLLRIAEDLFPDSVSLINIGGGFFGRPVPAMGLKDTPSYDDYATAIGEEFQGNSWVRSRQPRMIIEPGMAVVADTMSFVTRVFEVKEMAGRRLAVVDGSIFNVKPTFHSRNHPFELVQPEAGQGPFKHYDVVGSTCMEKDCLLSDIECRDIGRGDFICIGNVGAYTIVLTPPFILPAPPVVVREGDAHSVIRRRQEFADVFGTYLF